MDIPGYMIPVLYVLVYVYIHVRLLMYHVVLCHTPIPLVCGFLYIPPGQALPIDILTYLSTPSSPDRTATVSCLTDSDVAV